MAIGSINSINPFQKAYGASMFAAGSVKPAQSNNIFAQNNNQQITSIIDKNQSIYDINPADLQNALSGLNPFSSVNKTQNPVNGIQPVQAKANYENGLAPSSDLQNVFAGSYKGKANILNQIAIA